jgi:hypothetical protein
MPRVEIDGKIVISYDHQPKEIYWKKLSEFLIENHGKQAFKEQSKVEEILLDGFEFLIGQFKTQILSEDKISFFLYVFWLHEQSIELHFKSLSGQSLEPIEKSEFAMYRRILKLIIEQGCDIDMDWGEFPSPDDVYSMDNKIQDLLYIGTWLYSFADTIAYQKMIEDCHEIHFDDDNLLVVDWQFHYGATYKRLFPTLSEDYRKGVYDQNAVDVLIENINQCFNIDYHVAREIIFEIKKHHSPDEPEFQTAQPEVLPINLSKIQEISEENAKLFYDGLSISRSNKLTIEDAILKPYSTLRYMFRPILIYNIGGEDRALVGNQKFMESIMVLGTNAIHWNTMLSEWNQLKCIRRFIAKQGDMHDKILEDEIEKVIKSKQYYHCRNIKSFKQRSGPNIKIDNEQVGEIDFIAVNSDLKTIYVIEAKYNKVRYEAVGYRTDNTNFINQYESKLKRKLIWLKDNVSVLQSHLQIINNTDKIDLTGYEVDAVFVINTPTFYMFNGDFKALTLNRFSDFMDGSYDYPRLLIEDSDEGAYYIQHPYFKKPIII